MTMKTPDQLSLGNRIAITFVIVFVILMALFFIGGWMGAWQEPVS